MPFINVSNTSDPKNSVSPTPVFSNPITSNTSSTTSTSLPVGSSPNNSSSGLPIVNQKKQTLINSNNFVNNNSLQPLDKKLEVPHMIEHDNIKEYTNVLPIQPNNKVLQQPIKVDVSSSLENKLNNINEGIFKGQQIQVQDESLRNVSNQKQITNPEGLAYRNFDLNEILRYAITQNASDIHLTTGYRAILRVDGSLKVVNSPILTPVVLNQAVMELIKDRHDINFNSIHEADLTYSFERRRFRVNIFKQMGNLAIEFRIITDNILTPDELELPAITKTFSKIANGLVLVTGPTGSGKSTTIASIINLINLTEPKHIITIEDPVEFVFPKGTGLVDQREYGVDFTSWPNALRAILRQDPDVVLVGEMRDLETIEAALQIAETGHLVFATLHTNGAAETVNRIIDVFDSQKQDQIRIQLSSVLKAVLSQKLLAISGGGRKIATEVLISNPSVRNAIRDKKTFQIDNIIQTNSQTGMMSMEKSLVDLVRKGLISVETAKVNSNKPDEIDILMR